MSPSPTPSPDERAPQTMAAIMRSLYVVRRGLFGEQRSFGRRHYEELWPFIGIFAATTSLRTIDPANRDLLDTGIFVHGLDCYRRRSDPPGGDDAIGFGVQARSLLHPKATRFYDDNSWLALALLRANEQAEDGPLVHLAERVMHFVVSGWSEDANATHPGGIRWNDSSGGTTRNTCTNGPASEAAVLLYQATNDESWLDWAIRVYGWTRASLRGPNDLYLDHLTSDGSTDSTIWSYNQGAMIGAGVLLSEATAERSYLDDASETVDAALGHFTFDALRTQPSPFNAIFFSNLQLFLRQRPKTPVKALMAEYAEWLWSTRRDDGLAADRSGLCLNASAASVLIDTLLAGATAHA